MKKEEKNYYIYLTREIKNDKALLPIAKLLYGDICTLSKKTGCCFATNDYFAKEYDISRRTVSRHVKALRDRGLIRVEITTNEYGSPIRNITPLKLSDNPLIETVKMAKPKKKDFSYLD